MSDGKVSSIFSGCNCESGAPTPPFGSNFISYITVLSTFTFPAQSFTQK